MDTAEDICKKHNMKVMLMGYKDKSHTIHLSKEATFKEALSVVMHIFGREEDED